MAGCAVVVHSSPTLGATTRGGFLSSFCTYIEGTGGGCTGMVLLGLALALPLVLLGAFSAWNRAKADARRVASIGVQGVDLSQPQYVSFRFVFTTQASAELVADKLNAEYECQVKAGIVSGQVPGENEPRTIDGYLLTAVRPLHLEPRKLQAIGMRHAGLANVHAGYYMGWEPTLSHRDGA